MICRYCRNILPDDAAFCNRCGNRQDEPGGLVSPPFPIAPNSPGYYPAGDVPVVQGTPLSGNVPSVQGTPPVGNAPFPPHPVHPFAQPASHSAGNAASPYAPQPSLPYPHAPQQAVPYPQPAAPQSPTYYPPQPHDARNQQHAQTHHVHQGVHHTRTHRARQAGGISHAAIVVVTVAAVVIIGGGLAWAYAHNQQPSPAGPPSFTPTHIPTPTVFHLALNAAQDSPGLDTGINVAAGSRVTIIAQGTAAYGVSGAGCPEVTHPDGSIVSSGETCPPDMDPSATLASAPVGELLASIGQPGTSTSTGWFAVGSNYSQKASTNGRLFLIYNDDPGQYGNNSGSYQVTVTITAQ